MEKDAKIYVAGHHGMVGSAILRTLKAQGYTNFVLRTSRSLTLEDRPMLRNSSEQRSLIMYFLQHQR